MFTYSFDLLQCLWLRMESAHSANDAELMEQASANPMGAAELVQLGSGDASDCAGLAQQAAEMPAEEKTTAGKGVQYKLFRWMQPAKDDGCPAVTPPDPKVGRPKKPANPAADEELRKVVEEQAKQIQHLKEEWERQRLSDGKSRRRSCGSSEIVHTQSETSVGESVVSFGSPAQSAVVMPLLKSNRKQPGVKKISGRQDCTAVERIAMVDHMKTEMKKHARPQDFWRQMSKYYGRPVKQLQRFMDRYQADQEFVQRRKLGKGFGIGVHSRAGAKKRWMEVKKGLGKRSGGAGVKDEFQMPKERVKTWFEMERGNGITVYPADLLGRYLQEFKMELVELLKQQDAEFALERQIRIQKLEGRALKIMQSESYIKTTKMKLQAFVGAVAVSPSRTSVLTMEQEKVRARLTWQNLDYRIWQAAFAEEGELESLVADPVQFIENRHKTVIGFSDQIPVWVKMGSSGRQLFLETELKRSSKGGKSSAEGQEGQEGQRAAEDDEGEVVEMDTSGAPPEKSTLTRADGKSEEDKFRITYEARQVLVGYFEKGEEKPFCIVEKGLLVCAGKHCRLSNISADGKWIRDEKFIYAGVQTERKAGESVGNLMKGWRKLRSQNPELFEKLTVMQQPAAFVDSIIYVWSSEEMAEKYSQSIWVRDCFAAAFSPAAAAAGSLAQSLPSFVAAKMTPILQLTDSDFSARFKAAATRAKMELRSKIRQQFEDLQLRPRFACGLYEILFVADRAHRYCEALKHRRVIKCKITAANFVVGGGGNGGGGCSCCCFVALVVVVGS